MQIAKCKLIMRMGKKRERLYTDQRFLSAGNGMTFLTLLPPREALESQDPLRAQLNYHPKTAEVVRLSDVLQVGFAFPFLGYSLLFACSVILLRPSYALIERLY
jgi:hypothetical protein